MASNLQKLLRKQTLISYLNKPILSSPTRLPDPKPDPPVALIPFFNNVPEATDVSNPNPLSSTVYPSFAFEAFLYPFSQIGYFEPIVYGDEDRVVRADSVKKKRKKKMNKHKLKKLRKRLRRKT